jgi:hypothetical protein
MKRLLLLLAIAVSASADTPISAAARAHVVDEIARQIGARYVLADAAPKIVAALRAKSYDSASTAEAFALALTNDLRTIGDDLHFAVEFDAAHEQRLRAAGAGEGRKLPELPPSAEEREAMRRANYGFRSSSILEGNVGYLELTSFESTAYSRDSAVAAMQFLAHADAVIVDVRRNHGGSGNLVELLASYFLPPGAPLAATFDRETGKTTQGHALRAIPGTRRLDVPLFILGGPGTGSAAEAFAFVLQLRGRARLVGEKTQGAAQGGGWVPAAEGFVVFIPTFRAFDPATGKSWERAGVQPDVAAPAERALAVAHLQAVNALVARADEARKRELRWLAPLLDLDANGAKPVTPAVVDAIVARYRGIEIGRDGDALFFLGASGVRRPLIALADETFLIEDRSVPRVNQARVRFVRDEAGRVTALELLTASGQVLPRPRL